jgi:rare lipoprotein A
MHRRAIAVLAAGLVSALPMNAQAGKAGQRTFFGMAAFYPGRGGGLTAANKTLPFGTRVRVTDPKTGRSVVVTINDRGPFNRGRVLDLCTRAARALGMIDRGVIYVRADVLERSGDRPLIKSADRRTAPAE